MSLPPDTAAAAESKTSLWLTFLVALACFVIFLVVLDLAYIPARRVAAEVDLSKIPPEEQWKYTPEGRMAHLNDLRGREAAAQAAYAWIDKGKGVVQLPIDRAMQLTLQEINASRHP